MKIYAEWEKDGEIFTRFFDSYEEFHRATFSPDCNILRVQEMKF